MRSIICFGTIVLSVLFMSGCNDDVKKGEGEKNETSIDSSNKTDSVKILSDITSKIVREDLQTLPDSSLRTMVKKSENRSEYIRGIYAHKELQKVISDKKLDENKRLQFQIDAATNEIYIDELVRLYFVERKKDVITLAKDKYETNKDKYTTRRRIRIAQIFISKFNREEKATKEIVKEVTEKLADKEKYNFFDLADEYSEDKENAKKGGVYEKWLILPLDAKKLSKVIAAAFNLKEVGDKTNVIESRQGFHVIKLIEESQGKTRPFKDVQSALVSELEQELLATAKQEVRKTLYPAEDIKHNDEVLRQLIIEVQRNNKKTEEK